MRDMSASYSIASDMNPKSSALTIDDDMAAEVQPFSDTSSRRGDLTIFHFALPSGNDSSVRIVGRRTHSAVSQRDAGGVLCSLRRVVVSAGRFGSARAGNIGRLGGFGPWRFSTTAVSSSRWDSVRRGCFRSQSIHPELHARSDYPLSKPSWTNGSSIFSSSGGLRPTRRSRITSASPSTHKRYVDSHYRFIFVGRYDVVPRYYSMIRALMTDFRLLNERFIFTGPVPTRSWRCITGVRPVAHLDE